MREDQVEAAVRESLERHAREADVDVPVAERARAAADRGPGAGLLLAAAAVVAIVAGGVTIAQSGGGSGDNGPSRPNQPPTVADAPIDWRTEAWRGVEVKVPPEWGWGGAPVASNDNPEEGGGLLDCGVGPAGDAQEAYVGRSVYLTDACAVIDPDSRPEPEVSYVWLGAPLEKGTVRLGDYTEETIKVGGTTVTVATDDPELRAQILGTARPAPADAACAPRLSKYPEPAAAADKPKRATSMTVCAYKGGGSTWDLASAVRLDADRAQRMQRAISGSLEMGMCMDSYETELVTIRFSGEDAIRYVVVVNDCDHIGLRGPDGEYRLLKLSRENVEPWATGPIPATLHGPFDETGELAGLFIGILG